MKVFISWSGEQSRQAASVLLDWLPMVIQSVEPYMSEETDKGVRWSAAVGKELEQTDFGVICLTPENVEAPWIHFEAGALAKSMDNSRLAPILFGLKKSEVQGPLSQFQLTDFTQEDIRRLVGSMNSFKSEESLDSSRLDRIFQALWKQLNDGVAEATKSVKTKPAVPRVSSEAILEELLTLSRNQAKAIPELLMSTTKKLHVALMETAELRARPQPGYDSRPWEDLRMRWEKLMMRVDSVRGGDAIAPARWEEILQSIYRLRQPLEYLLRRYYRSSAKGYLFGDVFDDRPTQAEGDAALPALQSDEQKT